MFRGRLSYWRHAFVGGFRAFNWLLGLLASVLFFLSLLGLVVTIAFIKHPSRLNLSLVMVTVVLVCIAEGAYRLSRPLSLVAEGVPVPPPPLGQVLRKTETSVTITYDYIEYPIGGIPPSNEGPISED
jgi:hypothetical protein